MGLKRVIKKAVNWLYPLCPVFVQNLAVSLYGIRIYGQRYGRTYRRYLRLYSSRDYSSIRKAEQIQNREFLKLLHYAVRNSEFYKEFYREIDLSKIKSVDDIAALPILTKEILKKNLNRIYTIPARKGITLYTGGTTGIPIKVLMRRYDLQRRLAYLDAFKLEYGFIPNRMRCARFSGKNIVANTPTNHVFWRDNYRSKQRYYSTYHLTDTNISYYVKDLNKFRPEALEGLVSAIYRIARYMRDNDISLSFIPKAIFTTSETVLPIHRQVIEEAFRCPLRDQYASNDGAPFIKQCRFGAYHENIDTGVFEHIRTQRGVKLIVTSFYSYGTPLLRYDIGDYVLEADQRSCPCKSCHPMIVGIDGRTTDFIRTKTRGIISQTALSLLISELPDSFEQLQLIQENRDIVLVKVVMREGNRLEDYQEQLYDILTHYLGADMGLTIESVTCIKGEKSGKVRMIINRLEEELIL